MNTLRATSLIVALSFAGIVQAQQPPHAAAKHDSAKKSAAPAAKSAAKHEGEKPDGKAEAKHEHKGEKGEAKKSEKPPATKKPGA